MADQQPMQLRFTPPQHGLPRIRRREMRQNGARRGRIVNQPVDSLPLTLWKYAQQPFPGIRSLMAADLSLWFRWIEKDKCLMFAGGAGNVHINLDLSIKATPDDIATPGDPPAAPAPPFPPTRIRKPLSTPAGIRTVRVSCRGTVPEPPQAGQRFPTRPLPLHVRH